MLVFGYVDAALEPSNLCQLPKQTLRSSSRFETVTDSGVLRRLSQFEWAWQHPELSRHLHSHHPLSDEGTGQIFKKDARRNRVDRKAL